MTVTVFKTLLVLVIGAYANVHFPTGLKARSVWGVALPPTMLSSESDGDGYESDGSLLEESQGSVVLKDLRWDTHPKLIVDIALLGLLPDQLHCRHTEPCRCSTIVAEAFRRTHQRYSPGKCYSRIMPADKNALSYLKNDAIASVLPGPLAEVDIVACSAGGLAHVLALGSSFGASRGYGRRSALV